MILSFSINLHFVSPSCSSFSRAYKFLSSPTLNFSDYFFNKISKEIFLGLVVENGYNVSLFIHPSDGKWQPLKLPLKFTDNTVETCKSILYYTYTYMYTHVYVYICTHMYMYMCVRVHIPVHIYFNIQIGQLLVNHS